MNKFKVVAISDVHEKWQDLVIPECDLLVSCGDYSFRGSAVIVHQFHQWLNEQKATYIISLQGNHEVGVERDFDVAKAVAISACPKVRFVEHEYLEIEGRKIFCSAYTPTFGNWSYMKDRGRSIRVKWDDIPEGLDLLVTHGPPWGYLDVAPRNNEHVGCEELLKAVKEKQPKHHVFGHIHSWGGRHVLGLNGTHFYNASICNEEYRPVNSITEFEI